MDIVILHCHLERGGVTQVIENHVRSLRDRSDIERIVLVSGNRASGLTPETRDAVELLAVDDFDYDDREWMESESDARAETLFHQLQQQLNTLDVSSDDAILHWHNHSLGKNTASPSVIRRLALDGWRLLLQIHDFAEDNRPENYRRLIAASGATDASEIDRYLYPVAAQIGYCTLTQADAGVLREVGVPGNAVDCLPNSVIAPPGIDTSVDEARRTVRGAFGLPEDARWLLYPVRGIRRKNVGELLLLSLLASHDQFLALTLAPTTPVESQSYERWRRVAEQYAPRVVFDAGTHDRVSFACNLLASEKVVSTSVAEGFGMSFLEPWLVNREVVARNLPTVANDFEASGMTLDRFYDKLFIPGDHVWLARASECFDRSYEAAWSDLPTAFRPDPPQLNVEQGEIDFALLTPEMQTETITRAAGDRGFLREIEARNEQLVADLRDVPDSVSINRNASAVSTEYSADRAGSRLGDLYHKLRRRPLDQEIHSPENPGVGLRAVSRVRPYFPCRTEIPHQETAP